MIARSLAVYRWDVALLVVVGLGFAAQMLRRWWIERRG